MEHQLTVRIPRELNHALLEAAHLLERKPSEIVRMALREFLESQHQPVERPAKRVSHLVGSLRSGVPDLAAKHREHIIKSLRHGR
jgi:predicted HicB family RNase H-like nuclease